MEVRIDIYGKDYSRISFKEYDPVSNEGVKFEGIEYDKAFAEIILMDFLKRQNKCIRKGQYKVGKNDKRTTLNSLSLYAEYEGEFYYQNIVGVLSVKGYKISEGIILQNLWGLSEEKRKEYADHIYHINLQISSRFDGKHTYFLPTMFQCGKLDVNEYQVPQSKDNLFDFLLVFEFVRNLKKAYMCGVYRRYQRFQQNDNRVRGSIQIARHIRLNAGVQNGNVAYTYRENTADNAMNHLFLYTHTFIKKNFRDLNDRLIERDYECRKILNEIRNYAKSFGQVSTEKVMQQCTRQISQPFYMGYEKLRQTCFMLLNHMGISVFDGVPEETTEGILFYMPDLWEDFLESAMQREMHDFEIEPQKRVMVYKEENLYKHSTYPDFVFFHKNKPILVLDAKFKERWENGFDLNDYTKCIRDMNSLNIHATGVIYPVKDAPDLSDENVRHAISEYNQRDYFYKFPVYVPSSDGIDNYMEWVSKFEESLGVVIQVVCEYIREEMVRMQI